MAHHYIFSHLSTPLKNNPKKPECILIWTIIHGIIIKRKNTPTRARARLGTRRGKRDARCENRVTVHTPTVNATTNATSNATCDMRQLARHTQRKCNSFENDRVAYQARVYVVALICLGNDQIVR